DRIGPVRGERGRPRGKPRTLYADRGYDHDLYRRRLGERGIVWRIARRGEEHGSGLGTVRGWSRRRWRGCTVFAGFGCVGKPVMTCTRASSNSPSAWSSPANSPHPHTETTPKPNAVR